MKGNGREGFARMLSSGLATLSLDLDAAQQRKLLDYVELLGKWNRVYNLTAIRDPAQMVTQHLLDSLAAVPAFAAAQRVLDVGSGGGLPGIVLAIARPEMQVELIDTVQKKTAFLTQVKSELQLDNLIVHTGKVEDMPDATGFDVITSRAFASLPDFVTLSGHLLMPDGRFIALKGAVPQAEMAGLPPGWKVSAVHPLNVPGMEAERHLIIMERESA